MEKSILIISILFLSITSFAQQMLPTSKHVKTFLDSRTYVVQDNNLFGMYNSVIEEAVKKHWKVTNYYILSKNEYQQKKHIPTASMLIQTESHFEGQKELGVFTSLSLVLGKSGGNINTMPDIITFPIAYSEVDYDNYYYKLGLALIFMQKHIGWLQENPNVEDKALLNHYKKSNKNTKEKTLYLLKSEMAENINSISEIEEVYSGSIKFATQEEIKEAIDSKNEGILVLHLVAPARAVKGSVVTKMILCAADADMYYFDYHRVKGRRLPNKFLKSDFVKLEKL